MYCNILITLCSMFRSEFKREGAGRGNWGNQADEINQYYFLYLSYSLHGLVFFLCE